MDKIVLPLGSDDATIAVAGGKGYGLSRLAQAGFRVPPGFILTTSTYRTFVADTGIETLIFESLRKTSLNEPADFENVAAYIRSLFAGVKIPIALSDIIKDAYNELLTSIQKKSGIFDFPLAVRSSATAEDLPEASFAGQQDTILNVRGQEACLTAIVRCWSSLWSARAIAYRRRQGIRDEDLALAVIVQQLVRAEVSGILFTANPVNKNIGQLVVNASWGLGDAIVSGQVTPDTVFLDKKTGEITQSIIGTKTQMTRLTDAGTELVPVSSELRNRPVLTAEQAKELGRIGQRIEAAFGLPQDVEWAIERECLLILQARPITTQLNSMVTDGVLGQGEDDWPVPVRKKSHEFDLWTRTDLGERWPDPVSPLTWSLFAPLDDRSFRRSFRNLSKKYLENIQWTRRYYGRVYLNEGAIGYVSAREYGIPLSWTKVILGSQSADQNTSSDRFHPGRFLWHLPSFAGLTVQRIRSERIYEKSFSEIDAWVEGFSVSEPKNIDDNYPQNIDDVQLYGELKSSWLPKFERAMDLHADITITAMTAVPMLEWLLAHWGHPRELLQDSLGGLSGLLTAGIVKQLWSIAQNIRGLALPPEVTQDAERLFQHLQDLPAAISIIADIDNFLKIYGHRCPNELELSCPRWSESRTQLGAAILGYMAAGSRADPARGEHEQQLRQSAAMGQMGDKLSPLRRAFLVTMLHRMQKLVRLRDNGQHYLVKLFLPIRHTFAVLAERWVERGWLLGSDEIFFLTMDEIGDIVSAGNPEAAGFHLQQLIANRRKTYALWCTIHAPEVVAHNGQAMFVSTFDTADTPVLTGIPVSGGVVQGTARVVRSLEEALSLEEGSILITRATDPGWTPVFPLLRGLILEIGGPLSHGAIVAREFGIPAVVNVPAVGERIRDGQYLTLDGSTGHIYLYNASRG